MTHPMPHPILQAVSSVRDTLKTVADTNPTFMATGDKATALAELAAAEAQLVELRLRLLADAGDVAETSGARDAADWLAHHTRTRFEDARTDLRLAHALDRHPIMASAMRDGLLNLSQARVIAAALDRLHDLADSHGPLDAEVHARAEAHLVTHAADFGPPQLARLGRHILHTIAPEVADEIDAKRLAAMEAHATRKTRLHLRRLGDGTTRLAAILPDPIATRLAVYLEAFTNPRKQPNAETGDPFTRLPYPRRLGHAFCNFLETADPTRLPIHGGDATTLIVTITLDALKHDLATADLLGTGQIPTDPATDAGTSDQITAAQARRLACTANLIPAVLDGDSLPLDLGRAKRLFARTQRKALLLRDQTCRAEGCDIPSTWTEAHHLTPWSHNAPTDLNNAVLLCSHHHHRIHDQNHRTQRLPNGDLRFHRRR